MPFAAFRNANAYQAERQKLSVLPMFARLATHRELNELLLCQTLETHTGAARLEHILRLRGEEPECAPSRAMAGIIVEGLQLAGVRASTLSETQKSSKRPPGSLPRNAELWINATRVSLTVVGLALLSGLRRGERFALRWQHVDEPHGMLTVRQAAYEGEFDTPKTRAGFRQVPLSKLSFTL